MKSVRLDPDLQRQLREAAGLSDMPESQIMREAIAARCQEILGARLDLRLRDYVGALALGGRASRATGRRFAELLQDRERARGRG